MTNCDKLTLITPVTTSTNTISYTDSNFPHIRSGKNKTKQKRTQNPILWRNENKSYKLKTSNEMPNICIILHTQIE